MIKIEAITLENAYKDAASALECSVTELKVEVVQYPSKGFLGLFKKNAIIVVTKDETKKDDITKKVVEEVKVSDIGDESLEVAEVTPQNAEVFHELNDTIIPQSFVSTQDYEYEEEEAVEEDKEIYESISQIASSVEDEINELFDLTCFSVKKIKVSVYDENTLLVEFQGEDAALLIGKEGYRYKALSYMIFNWINSKYKLQLRLEIAEFLKNQEEAVARYLEGVKESVDRDGRAQTKILDGVLVQIALRELRDMYPDKYVAIRSTRDGLKYIIINDYHS
jgi:spoIIIJ-associated protein